MKAAKRVSTIMEDKLIKDFFKVSISFIAIDIPTPKIGPIRGEINMAPITTAVELAFNPTEATNAEHIKIQAVAPLKGISDLMAEMVASRSVSFLKSNNSIKNRFIEPKKPKAVDLMDSLLGSESWELDKCSI